MNEERPNPESLLKMIKQEERDSRGGKFKIFFGMAAGSGKTYAMLEDAQRLVREGVDLVIGCVYTHGRQETADLLKGLKIIKEREVPYKDVVLHELDLDTILKLKPQLVLVDELAHSNAPGSRHPKRWQDVMELLDAGIDVNTTLNVQHLESRKEVIEDITGITIRETVPDIVLDRADTIELVDIPPKDLLKRLKEGKVYLGPQSEVAIKNFFQPDRLTALRQITLQITAEKVDHDLHEMIRAKEHGKVWRTRERLLVAVNQSLHSQKLIRTARRLAFNLDAPWIAVNVDTGSLLSEEESALLMKNLALARSLGAEIVTIKDTDIASAIQRIAKKRNVSQIIVGRPERGKILSFLKGGSILDQLSRQLTDIDLYVVRQHEVTPVKKFERSLIFPTSFISYFFIALIVALIVIGTTLIAPWIGYQGVGLLYLIALLLLSLFFSAGPLFFAAILVGVWWYASYIYPLSSMSGVLFQEITVLLLYFMTAAITGILTSRLREKERLIRGEEAKTQIIYDIVKEITTAPTLKDLVLSVTQKISSSLDGKCEMIVKEIDGQLIFPETLSLLKDEKEKAIAIWVFTNGKEAGLSTDTLPSLPFIILPLKGFQEVLGVLIFEPSQQRKLGVDDLYILYTVSQQLSYYLERFFQEERSRRREYQSKIEQIHSAILNSVSKDFKDPLIKIQEAVDTCKKKTTDIETAGKVIEDQVKGLQKIIDNALAMSKLSTKFVPLHKERHHPKDLINACLEELKKSLIYHHIKVDIDPNMPLVPFDFSLLELLLCNLIINAVEYTPKYTTITIKARIEEDQLVISVIDQGSGIPQELIARVFEKFYRIPGTKSQGLGLGLSIAKTIAEIHHGRLEIRNRKPTGAEFSFYIPIP